MPIKLLIAQTFLVPYALRERIAMAILLPCLLSILIGSFQTLISLNQIEPLQGWSWILSLLSIFVYVLIAINVHRILLVGLNSVPVLGLIKWTRRETMFVVWTLVLMLVNIVVSIPVGLLTSLMLSPLYDKLHFISIMFLAFIPAYLAFALFSARLSPIFAHIAVDNYEGLNLNWVWNLTRGYTWPLMVVVSIVPILPYVMMTSLYSYFFWSEINQTVAYANHIYMLGDLFFSILSCVFTVFLVSSISVTYRWLMENNRTMEEWSS